MAVINTVYQQCLVPAGGWFGAGWWVQLIGCSCGTGLGTGCSLCHHVCPGQGLPVLCSVLCQAPAAAPLALLGRAVCSQLISSQQSSSIIAAVAAAARWLAVGGTGVNQPD